ncbi:MAG: thioredoxin family protein [Planctomycetota bacterium]|jgi:hypothetical protein
MDRSFLSDDRLIEAARKWVCIRLATYESKDENEVLKGIFKGRTGEVENSTFCLLAPDGKTKLSRAGRSPQMVYRDASAMAGAMDKAVKKYALRGADLVAKTLPASMNVRLGVNIASCDGRPVVLAWGTDAKAAAKVADSVNDLAWTKDFRGKFEYVVSGDSKERKIISGLKSSKSGVAVLQPGPYGLKATVLAQVTGEPDSKALEKVLSQGLKKHKAEAKDSREHIRKGERMGVDWETAIPSTDPHSKDRPKR